MKAKNKQIYFYASCFMACLIDQVTKQLALNNLGNSKTVSFGFIKLYLIKNSGVAFALLSGKNGFILIVNLVVAIIGTVFLLKVKNSYWGYTLGIFLGGAYGNIIDRIFRFPGLFKGSVVDFISYGNFFIGNVADIFVVVCAFLMLLYALFSIPYNKRINK